MSILICIGPNGFYINKKSYRTEANIEESKSFSIHLFNRHELVINRWVNGKIVYFKKIRFKFLRRTISSVGRTGDS